MEDIKKNISTNLVLLRKASKKTQQELAKELNYSDKAVSRWEVGDSLPDIGVLIQICELYGVDFDWLIHEHNEAVPPTVSKKTGNGIRIAIVLLFAAFCFAFATIVFIYSRLFRGQDAWIAFIWAVPVSLSFAVHFSRRWSGYITTTVLLSLNMWTLLTAVYLQILLILDNIWSIFLLGIPVQVMFILFCYIRIGKSPKKVKKDKTNSK